MKDWLSEEQYPDPTAGEAMDRVFLQNSGNGIQADDEGCRLLAEAIVSQAVTDYRAALRYPVFSARDLEERAEVESFFRSDYFRRLSRLDGEWVIRLIRKAVKQA